MDDWTREKVLQWFEGQANKQVTIRQRGTMLRVQGTCKGLDEIDACSAHYQECMLIPSGVDVDVGLSFHDDTMSIHLIGHHPSSGRITVSLPVSIPYAEVMLGHPDEEASKKPEAGEKRIPSPYELL